MTRGMAMWRDVRGTVVVETALVMPFIVLLGLGGFEVSRMVSRQHELQSGVAEAQAVALAANAGAQTDTMKLKAMLQDSLDLSNEQVFVQKRYRCDANPTVTGVPDCPEDAVVSTYLHITLRDDHTPIWTKLGFGTDVAFNVERTVQLS